MQRRILVISGLSGIGKSTLIRVRYWSTRYTRTEKITDSVRLGGSGCCWHITPLFDSCLKFQAVNCGSRSWKKRLTNKGDTHMI